VPGNTVVSGHNTGYGEVFRDLYQLEPGDTIIAYSGETAYIHTISEVVLVREQGLTLEARRRNARYVEPTDDQRLTLITCHPYGSLRYRLIVVARPGISPTTLDTRRAEREE
jgi:sortase A